jgi:2-keto-3-deoxy-6-phosphogluconate aldolase
MNDIPEARKAKARLRLTIFNVTDGIPAMEKTFSSPEEAEQAIRKFRQRFEVQGYYTTSAGQRINPADIKLEIVQS